MDVMPEKTAVGVKKCVRKNYNRAIALLITLCLSLTDSEQIQTDSSYSSVSS